MNEVFPTRVGVHGMSVQKDQPPAAGAALVQFVPSDVITFQLVPAAIAGTRTHSTAIIPALTRERVVSEACQSSILSAQNDCVILPASCAYTVSK